jgi:hypothetical protein
VSTVDGGAKTDTGLVSDGVKSQDRLEQPLVVACCEDFEGCRGSLAEGAPLLGQQFRDRT